MATITTILSTDAPSNSRAVINTNFSNLNTDKIETSVLDTSGTLAANSDSKVATQKATKTYVDTQVATNAAPTCVTCIPYPSTPFGNVATSLSVTGNTTAHVGQVVVPFGITVNKITIRTGAVTVAGTYILSLFSEDGQTRKFSVTTANITTTSTLYTTAVSAVVLTAGNYYLVAQPVSTANITINCYDVNQLPFTTTEGMHSDISGEPVLFGTVTVTADTAPSTLTPASISESTNNEIIICRLDN